MTEPTRAIPTTPSVLAHVQVLLVRDLKALKREIEAFPDDDSVWSAPPGITNPAGTLALHACGNLRHYVGHVLGGTDYVRDREREFAARGLSRASLAGEINQAIDDLEAVIPHLDPSALERPFPETVGGMTLNTQLFLLHLCTHLSFHLGQVGYLRRIVTGSGQSMGASSLKELSVS